ncbi:histone PARylation factor 1-like [Papilio machaon]|uniref:histone PARylation factor 1-like n=1 Tax=Papilio machaon TaxID=76193 RepID=UPI001E664A43|nr:histone PARylation factor 1-like [Papilio machaon]
MSEEWKSYVNDTRTICKYGAKCYQKNPEHHKTFKHPPKNVTEKFKNNRGGKARMHPYAKNKNPIVKDTEVLRVEPSSSDDKNPKEDISVTVTNNEKIDTHKESSPLVKSNETSQLYDKSEDNKLYKELFLVEMPSDFFQFYKCLSDEQSVDKTLASVNLQLIGPYDLLLGKLPMLDDKELYLVHWRFFYDPPEFQAVLKKKGKSEFHIGYYRDDPDSKPEFVASNDSAKDCLIQPLADNIFGAVYNYLQNEKNASPFLSMPCQKLMEKVKKWASDNNFSLDEYDRKKRSPVTKTLHGAGIVVPFNKKTELGYRPLVESNANLKKMFAKLESSTSQKEKDEVLSQLQPVITYASIAVDECDFGTGLEIGIDLFCSGLKELESNAASSLCTAYSLLKRDAFANIIKVHLKHRRKGPNMSIF